MARIDIHFGNATSEKVIKQNEQWALNREVSIELANIGTFNAVLSVLATTNNGDGTYFDLAFGCVTGLDVISPKVTYGTYQFNKTKYPKLSIHGDYLIDIKSSKEVFITDEWIEKTANLIEDDFDYEFVEFKRIGKVKTKKDEIIYLINGKPHFHHNGRFIQTT
jgi:hypothetical protein